MNNSLNIKRMVGIASLAAVVAVLQLISLFVRIGEFNVTLALIPLVVGAIIYGPKGGAVLGFVMGFIVLLTNSQAFFVVNPLATILLCILKSTIAGVASGYLFKWLSKINFVLAITVASIAAPLVNTGIFAVGCVLFFFPTLTEWAGGSNTLGYLFIGLIGVNFIVEFIINSVLSPVVVYIVRVIAPNYSIGSNLEE